MCTRSDSGGLQFGPGVPANNGATGCGGLNGHVKVAPNGTVYLPVKNCGATEGGDVSTDARVFVQPPRWCAFSHCLRPIHEAASLAPPLVWRLPCFSWAHIATGKGCGVSWQFSWLSSLLQGSW